MSARHSPRRLLDRLAGACGSSKDTSEMVAHLSWARVIQPHGPPTSQRKCSPSLWFRSGTEDRQDCDETRPAPLMPGGQVPDQASSSNRAGVGNHERTGRSKASKPVIPRVTPAVTNPLPITIRLRWRSSQSYRRLRAPGKAGPYNTSRDQRGGWPRRWLRSRPRDLMQMLPFLTMMTPTWSTASTTRAARPFIGGGRH
jgi:hypothetical protein